MGIVKSEEKEGVAPSFFVMALFGCKDVAAGTSASASTASYAGKPTLINSN
jgi:hypothetical protein